jgi:hypothetical protein
MIARKSAVVVAFFAVAMTAQPALSQGVAGTVRSWGLPGAWAVNCRAAHNASNPLETIVIEKSGRVMLHRNFGNLQDSNEILGARVNARGMLVLRVRFTSIRPPETREWGMVKSRYGQRRRAIYNRNVADNTYTIRNGVVLATGRRSIPYRRCR